MASHIDSKKSQGKDILTQGCPKYHLWTQKRITTGLNRNSHGHCLFVIFWQVITSGGITFHDQPWHKECFLCSGCRKELCEEEFMSRDDYPFCLDCYNHLYAKKCAACTKPITGEFFSLIWSYDGTVMACRCYIVNLGRKVKKKKIIF